MRFTPQFLDELRARLPVSEVVGRRVKLQKSGREWKGLSPFNKEKTASFFVNDQKQAWFDFSSGKNGSIFDFVMLTDGVEFPEAVERLAAMAGVPMPQFSKEEEAREEKRKTLHDVMELAAKFFEAQLASRVGAKARGYLADRALDPATQLKFRMGYAPAERFALKEHLGEQGVPVPDMVEAGLLIAGDDIPVPYDRFRDRVMFPIHDFRGRIIAFGGRALVAGRAGEISQLAGDAALSQGLEPLQRLCRAHGGARRRAAHRGRRLCRRDRDGDGGLSRRGRAARHRAHRGAARHSLEDGRRADPLLRRRQGRPARGLSRRSTSHCRGCARQEPALCAAARRAGPGRSGPLRRPRGGRRCARRRASARRDALDARDRGRLVRHAGAPRGAGGQAQRAGARHRRRVGPQVLPAGFHRPASRTAQPQCRPRPGRPAARRGRERLARRLPRRPARRVRPMAAEPGAAAAGCLQGGSRWRNPVHDCPAAPSFAGTGPRFRRGRR